MEQDGDVVWSDRPWIAPSLLARTVGVLVVGILSVVVLSALGVLTRSLLAVPLYGWALGVLALVWLASIAGLLVLRASNRYVLRQSSIQIDQGVVGRKSLVVSPSAFAELEVDQGLLGRMLNYGSVEVRSQGGQQLKFRLIRDPRGVSVKIRSVMTVPTVRIADGRAAVPPPN